MVVTGANVRPPPGREQQEHTDTVQSLRFTLDFARCLMEVAGARGGRPGAETPPPGAETPPPGSQVADQISSLSREWR